MIDSLVGGRLALEAVRQCALVVPLRQIQLVVDGCLLRLDHLFRVVQDEHIVRHLWLKACVSHGSQLVRYLTMRQLFNGNF